jgi:hypothetical protein
MIDSAKEKRAAIRAKEHAWWVTSQDELNDLCPLQLILGRWKLSVTEQNDPTPSQRTLLDEAWTKRYACLLDLLSKREESEYA